MNENATHKDGAKKITVPEDEALEYRRMQEALKESEEKFRALGDSTPTAILLYQDNRFIYMNKAAETISGYSAAELYNINLWGLIHPDYQAMIQERGRKHQKGEETVNRYEFKIIAKGGAEKWVDLAEASTMVGGRPAGILSLADMTDRKRMEEGLRQSEAKYRLLTETLVDVIFTTDENLRITYVSPAVTRLRGYSVEEATGEKVDSILTPESLKLALESFQQEMKLEASGFRDPHRILKQELELTRKDGSTVWAEVIFKPIRNEEDRFTGVLALARDISDRKKVRKELHTSEEKYRLLTETLPDIIFTTDENLRITYVNPAVTRFRGYTVQEAMAQCLEEILTPASLEIARKAFAEEMAIEASGSGDLHRTRTIELEENCKDGSTVWTETIFSALRDQDHKMIGMLGITRNITERRKAIQERENMIAERQKALSEIKILGGMLPICSSCKKIRNDRGYWEQLENYISDHSVAEFTHGLCPDCTKKFSAKTHKIK